MKNEPKKGGKRIGAGRRPAEIKKQPVTIYTDVSKFGGKEGARMAIYKFLDGKIHDTGKSAFIPLDIPDELGKISKWPPGKGKPANDLKPQEQPKPNSGIAISEASQEAIKRQIAAIRAESIQKDRDTPIGRKAWAMEQKKRIEELEKKLK